ncbi:hypothetical protein V9T40_014755 [Parthenolecanium corni]|uniref:Uncharacterized protein n=1 Tax=Parthenolecanium corni TaxID=536013 RepID=A0AAN9T6K7_9HEMI
MHRVCKEGLATIVFATDLLRATPCISEWLYSEKSSTLNPPPRVRHHLTSDFLFPPQQAVMPKKTRTLNSTRKASNSWNVSQLHKTVKTKIYNSLLDPNTRTRKYTDSWGQTYKVRIVERRCAPQQSRVLEYRQRWVPVNVIDEKLYVEGCSWEQIDFKVTKTEYCYCSSNYCNSGQRVAKTSVFHHTDVMFIIFIVNSIKFILSIR